MDVIWHDCCPPAGVDPKVWVFIRHESQCTNDMGGVFALGLVAPARNSDMTRSCRSRGIGATLGRILRCAIPAALIIPSVAAADGPGPMATGFLTAKAHAAWLSGEPALCGLRLVLVVACVAPTTWFIGFHSERVTPNDLAWWSIYNFVLRLVFLTLLGPQVVLVATGRPPSDMFLKVALDRTPTIGLCSELIQFYLGLIDDPVLFCGLAVFQGALVCSLPAWQTHGSPVFVALTAMAVLSAFLKLVRSRCCAPESETRKAEEAKAASNENSSESTSSSADGVAAPTVDNNVGRDGDDDGGSDAMMPVPLEDRDEEDGISKTTLLASLAMLIPVIGYELLGQAAESLFESSERHPQLRVALAGLCLFMVHRLVPNNLPLFDAGGFVVDAQAGTAAAAAAPAAAPAPAANDADSTGDNQQLQRQTQLLGRARRFVAIAMPLAALGVFWQTTRCNSSSDVTQVCWFLVLALVLPVAVPWLAFAVTHIPMLGVGLASSSSVGRAECRHYVRFLCVIWAPLTFLLFPHVIAAPGSVAADVLVIRPWAAAAVTAAHLALFWTVRTERCPLTSLLLHCFLCAVGLEVDMPRTATALLTILFLAGLFGQLFALFSERERALTEATTAQARALEHAKGEAAAAMRETERADALYAQAMTRLFAYECTSLGPPPPAEVLREGDDRPGLGGRWLVSKSINKVEGGAVLETFDYDEDEAPSSSGSDE